MINFARLQEYASQGTTSASHANAAKETAAREAREKAAAKTRELKQIEAKKEKAAPEAEDPVAAMQAMYPKLKECAALVKLGLTAADTVRACLYTHFALYIRIYGPIPTDNLGSYVVLIGNVHSEF